MTDTHHNDIPASEDFSHPVTPPSRLFPNHDEQSHRMMLLVLRLMFLVLLVTMSLLPFASRFPEKDVMTAGEFVEAIGVVVASFAVGVIVVLADIATPNKRLSAVFGVYLGLMAGLVGALAIGALIDLVAESWNLVGETQLAFGCESDRDSEELGTRPNLVLFLLGTGTVLL